MHTFLWWLHRLPRNAKSTYTEWPITEGGVYATAWTDQKGKPYLSASILNRIGKTTGLPGWLRRRRFKSDMVVGFIGNRPLVMNVRITALKDGLELVIRMPRDIKSARDFIERRFTPWGSNTPSFSIMLSPTFEPHAAKGFPTESF